jgi:hypothetical protein
MTVSWNMDLGQIIQVVVIITAVVGAHFSLKTRMDSLEKAIDKFGLRLDRHESAISKVTGEVQRVIGQLESDRHDMRRFREDRV